MFSTWGRLLRRDGLIRFAGYQTPQEWLSRTLTPPIALQYAFESGGLRGIMDDNSNEAPPQTDEM